MRYRPSTASRIAEFALRFGVSHFEVAASAQTPVEPLDMRADSVLFFYPTPDSITIAFYFTIYTTAGPSVNHSSGVTISLDGVDVIDQPIYFSSTSNDCDLDPNCEIPCEVQMQGGQPVWDNCEVWTTWFGAGCDPSDPTHTCTPIDLCACGAHFVLVATVDYEDEDELIAVVDGPLHPGVNEADKTNNLCHMVLPPVSTQPTTCGFIKSLFR